MARAVVGILALALTGAGALQGAAPDQVDALRAQLEDVLRGVGWRSAEWGVLAVSLDTGDTLFARNPDASMAPASNLKLVTTAAALEHLGPEYRYQTLVLADGPVRGGLLRGDLILYGTGDPGLSDRFHATRTAAFESLAEQLLDAGILAVDGDVVGDGSFFSGPLRAPGWDPRDFNDWYAAPSSALAFNENMVTLRIEAGVVPGARPIVHTVPAGADLALRNDATTGLGRLRIGREAPTEPVVVEGAIPVYGREVWRRFTIGDPDRYAARIFANVLAEKGIPVRGRVRTVKDGSASRVTGKQLWAPGMREEAPRVVARHRSPPLREYLDVVNKRSHNLLADMILKTVGRVVTGDGSFEGGARVAEAYMARALGVDTAAVEIHDGSGLSELNRIAPGDLVRLVDHMSRTPGWEAWWASLPEAGDPRELRRMYRTRAAGNLRAKTGTIQGVSALSGMVRSVQGERIAFSIIGNDLPSTWSAKRVEDRIATRLASFDRPFEVHPGVRIADGPLRSPPAVPVHPAADGTVAGGPTDGSGDAASPPERR